MKRLAKVERLRVVSMAAVVMNHVNVVALHQFDYSQAMNQAYWSLLLHVLSRFAVPCFFAISGYLMLAPSYAYSLEKLLRKTLPKYLGAIAFYGTGFAWMELVFGERTVRLGQIPRAVYGMLTGASWDHLWYLYAYVGLLLLYPMLKLFWQGADDASKRFVLLAGFACTSVFPLLKIGIRFPVSSAHLFCFLGGGYLRDLEERGWRPEKKYLWGTVAGCGAVLAGLTYFTHFYGSALCNRLMSDTSALVILYAAAISELCIFSEGGYASKRLLRISENSFGVYIYHMLWLNVLYKVVRLNPYRYGTAGMLVCIGLGLIGTIALSAATTAVTKKLPVVKRLI